MQRLNDILRYLFSELKAFVFSRDIVTFALCLLLTSSVWFFHAMNHKRSPEFSISVVYTGTPENVIVQGLPEKIKVEISDEGRNFFANRQATLDTIYVDLSPYIGNEKTGSFQISYTDLSNIIRPYLAATAKVVNIKPQQLSGDYTRQVSRIVPILIQGSVEPEEQHILVMQPQPTPNNVRVFGPHNVIDTLTAVYTTRLDVKHLSDTLKTQLALIAPHGCTLKSNTVTVMAAASQFTEKTFTIPVEVVNAPEGKTIRVLPSEVTVTCNISLSHYKEVSESDIHVLMDYSLHDESEKIILTPHYSPEMISNVRLNPTTVDFIVE